MHIKAELITLIITRTSVDYNSLPSHMLGGQRLYKGMSAVPILTYQEHNVNLLWIQVARERRSGTRRGSREGSQEIEVCQRVLKKNNMGRAPCMRSYQLTYTNGLSNREVGWVSLSPYEYLGQSNYYCRKERHQVPANFALMFRIKLPCR